MKTLSRLTLAALLGAAVSLPALAEVASKPDAGKPTVTTPAGKPAPLTDKGGNHAPVTQATPPASAPGAPKTN